MKVKVIQTDIKMQNSVVSIITPSLKEIGLQMSEHNPTLKFVCFFVCFFYYEIM